MYLFSFFLKFSREHNVPKQEPATTPYSSHGAIFQAWKYSVLNAYSIFLR